LSKDLGSRTRTGERSRLRTADVNLLDLPELVAVAQDEVHVFVEGLEGADEDAAVLQDAPHPEVDVLQHLAALTHRLEDQSGDCVNMKS